MALFCRARARLLARAAVPTLAPPVRRKQEMHDPLDHVTGIEKRELLAHLAGDCDPFHLICIKRGPGTRERPNLVPSAFNSRIVGCLCIPDTTSPPRWMYVHEGTPKRCECGFWFELCPVPPL